MATAALSADRGSRRNTAVYAVLLALPFIFLLHGLTAYGLLNNVEGLYAEMGREMLAGGNWIIPQLNGLPYIEKPPLLPWLLAASMRLFGVNDLAVRLVPISAGLLSLATTGWTAARLVSARCGVIAASVLASSIGFLVLSKVAMTDGLLSMLLNAALLLSFAALAENRRAWLRLAYACLALAILAKGLVAPALYGLVGAAYLAIGRRSDWRQCLRFLADPWGLGLFLLITAPWHIAACLELKEFAWFYFVNEHPLRFLGLREPKDYYSGSVFYYLPRLLGFFLPWAVVLVAGFFRQDTDSRLNPDLKRFLWCMVLVPLAFFSISSAKANYYVIVCLPALATLTALVIEGEIVSHASAAFERRVVLGLFGVWLALAPLEILFVNYGMRTEADFSARPMAHFVMAQRRQLPVFLYRDFEDYSALSFYLQHPLGVIDEGSEDLMFGLRVRGLSAMFPDNAKFVAAYPAAWVIVRDARWREFQRTTLAERLEEVGRIGNATLYRWEGVRSAG